MKKLLVLSMFFVLLFISIAYSKPPKGGLVPCLATCCLGPRVGIEMNEGTKVRSDEWIGLAANAFLGIPAVNEIMSSYKAFTGESMNEQREAERLGGPVIKAVQPKETGGFVPAFASCCLGARIGLEMNDGRSVRTVEWLSLVVPIIPRTIMAYEAFSGTTMSEIAADEGLDL